MLSSHLRYIIHTFAFQEVWTTKFCHYFFVIFYRFLDAATLTGVFPCFFLSCKANARVNLAKTGHGPHSPKLLCCLCIVCFVSFCVLFGYTYVLYYCHRVTTQLQLINISIFIYLHVQPIVSSLIELL